jgi:hypothetical protein
MSDNISFYLDRIVNRLEDQFVDDLFNLIIYRINQGSGFRVCRFLETDRQIFNQYVQV